MTNEEIIENEYRLFLNNKLPFEIIYPDNYNFLRSKSLLNPTFVEIEIARVFVKNYRITLIRNNLSKMDEYKSLFRNPSTRDERIKYEHQIREKLIEKYLVYNFYENQRVNNKFKIFCDEITSI